MALCIILLCITDAGCLIYSNKPGGAVDVERGFRTGTSFGFCVGYCRTQVDITASTTTITSSGWDTQDYPERSFTQDTPGDWWESLTAAFDPVAFAALDDTYGCPDCADGGAEWFEVVTDTLSKRVTIEYNAALSQIAPLMEVLRLVRDEMEKAADWDQER